MYLRTSDNRIDIVPADNFRPCPALIVRSPVWERCDLVIFLLVVSMVSSRIVYIVTSVALRFGFGSGLPFFLSVWPAAEI